VKSATIRHVLFVRKLIMEKILFVMLLELFLREQLLKLKLFGLNKKSMKFKLA
jgi:hypothetical protein